MAWAPSRPKSDEPVFHEAWEARVYVLTRAIGAWRKWNIDTGRYYIEQIAPAGLSAHELLREVVHAARGIARQDGLGLAG